MQTRLLAKGLLPVDIDSHGLRTALEDLAMNTEKLTPIPCRVKRGASINILDKTVVMHLYRIAQEAVTNAVKHSHAKEILISLAEENGQLTLLIADNGVGIPDGAVPHDGLGLSIMNSRAETMNATLQVRRGDQGGTEVRCSLRSPRKRYENITPR